VLENSTQWFKNKTADNLKQHIRDVIWATASAASIVQGSSQHGVRAFWKLVKIVAIFLS
jgi:hypothetical protein